MKKILFALLLFSSFIVNAQVGNQYLVPVVYAASFGLKGDSSTDNTSALNVLATYVNSLSRGATVVFAPGVYLTSGGHTFNKTVHIVGQGATLALNPTTPILGNQGEFDITKIECTSATATLLS